MILRNRYVGLRHGESKANLGRIIVSSLARGKDEKFGLTPKGRNQVTALVSGAMKQELLDSHTIIYASPFSRTRQTAEIAHEILQAKEQICFEEKLRERWFGSLEGTDSGNYQKVWDLDLKKPAHKEFDVESACEVRNRAVECFLEIDSKHSGKIILLVSHCDPLALLCTFFLGKLAGEHRQHRLEFAEIRELVPKNDYFK